MCLGLRPCSHPLCISRSGQNFRTITTISIAYIDYTKSNLTLLFSVIKFVMAYCTD